MRVFPQQGADAAGAFNVSIQKLSISDADKEKLDLSELHLAAALQSDSSPFFMNGTDPWYKSEAFRTEEGYIGFRWRKATSSDADKGVNSGGIYPMAQDMITPDGYTVDSLGRWCINGVPQSRQLFINASMST